MTDAALYGAIYLAGVLALAIGAAVGVGKLSGDLWLGISVFLIVAGAGLVIHAARSIR